MPEGERRARATQRWQTTPGETFEMTAADQDRFLASYERPTDEELARSTIPSPSLALVHLDSLGS